jgi:Flp pilus assembly protein TadG
MTRRAGRDGLRADTRGTAAMEFAIIGVALMLVTLGAIDLGLILWTQGGLQAIAAQAARCGAIQAAACTGSNSVESYIRSQANNWVMSTLSSRLTIATNSNVNTAKCPSLTVGSYETVQISTSYLASWLPWPMHGYMINVCASYASSS